MSAMGQSTSRLTRATDRADRPVAGVCAPSARSFRCDRTSTSWPGVALPHASRPLAARRRSRLRSNGSLTTVVSHATSPTTRTIHKKVGAPIARASPDEIESGTKNSAQNRRRNRYFSKSDVAGPRDAPNTTLLISASSFSAISRAPAGRRTRLSSR